MKVAIGQPAEHLPHWKQRRTEVPERASTFRSSSSPGASGSWEPAPSAFAPPLRSTPASVPGGSDESSSSRFIRFPPPRDPDVDRAPDRKLYTV